MTLQVVCWHEDLGDVQVIREYEEDRRRYAEGMALEMQRAAHTGEVYYIREIQGS